MKKIQLYFIFFLLLILLPTGVRAAGSHPLSLHEAIAIALRDSPFLHASNAKVRSAVEGEKASKGQLLPRLDAYAGYQRTSDPVVVVPIKGFNTTPPAFSRDHYQTGLTFSFPLYEGGRRWTRIITSELAKTIAGQELTFSKQEIIANVTNTFNQILSLKDLETAQQRILTALNKVRKDTQKRLELGRAAPVELMKMDTQVAQEEQDLIHTREATIRARQALAALLGKNPVRLPAMEGKLSTTAPALPEVTEAHLEEIIKKRPDIQKSLQEVKLAAANIKLQRGYNLPDIDLMGDYGQRAGSGFNDNEEVWTAGIKVNFNVFNGGVTSARIRQAKAELTAAKEKLQQQKLMAMTEIQQSRSRIKEADNRIKMAIKAIRSAQESYRIEELKYRTGAGTITDSLLAQAAWFQTEALKAGAVYELEKAVVDYRLATGIIEEGI